MEISNEHESTFTEAEWKNKDIFWFEMLALVAVQHC